MLAILEIKKAKDRRIRALDRILEILLDTFLIAD